MSGSLAAQTISFNEISYDIRRPSTQIEIAADYRNVGLIGFPTKALLMGQMLSTGNAQPATVYQIFRAGQGADRAAQPRRTGCRRGDRCDRRRGGWRDRRSERGRR